MVVMLRTDVFRMDRSRATKVKPKPPEVFDIVNEVVASALSARPLGFPDLCILISRTFPVGLATCIVCHQNSQ